MPRVTVFCIIKVFNFNPNISDLILVCLAFSK